MRITKGRLRQIIREVIKENFSHEESIDPRIASMHDKYKKKHRLFDSNDIDLLVGTYMSERYQFEKMTSMRELPDRLAKLLVEYNARVYYDKNLEDTQKLELMIGNEINPVSFKEKTKNEDLLPDEKHSDTFETSSGGIQFNLYYKNQNRGVSNKTTSKVTVSLKFKPGVLTRLSEFLKTKDIGEK